MGIEVWHVFGPLNPHGPLVMHLMVVHTHSLSVQARNLLLVVWHVLGHTGSKFLRLYFQLVVTFSCFSLAAPLLGKWDSYAYTVQSCMSIVWLQVPY